MLKESIICIIIVISILFGNYKIQDYTKESVSKITASINELRNEIIKDEKEINREEVQEKMDEVSRKWEERHDILAYFIEHDELEKVETHFTSLKSYIQTEEFSESISELDEGEFILKHIEEKYAFSMENIF